MLRSPAAALRAATPILLLLLLVPGLALAQASPFLTGANSLVTNFVAWATPIAILVLMGIAILAMAGRMTVGTAVFAVLGIAILFGAPQIVTWARGMFAV
jgi:type IV secretory pathway VirB2 component (pilin)